MSYDRDRLNPPVSPGAAIGVAVLAIAAIGTVDYAIGPHVSLLAFYLVPGAWVTVHAGRRAGFAAAVLAAVTAFTANVLLHPHAQDMDANLWNTLLRMVTFAIVVELVHRVREQARAARAAERRSQEFLASAAHQLRTPLAGIRATVDALLVSGNVTAQQEELLVKLSRESSRAGRHLSSLLRMARLDQNEDVPLRNVDLDELLRVEVERAASTRPGVAWDLRPSANNPLLVGNPDAIGEAVANLLDNAGRHARTRVDVTVLRSGGEVEIRVRDDGPGLPAGAEATVFERFVSLDHQGGSGLGLPIARGIVEAHRGRLDYVDGAFVIRLPAREPALATTTTST